MSFMKRIVDAFYGQSASPAELPPIDDGPFAAFAAPARRANFDSVLNAVTQVGSRTLDKGASADVDIARDPLDHQRLKILYRYNGLVRRIVDLLPLRATRKGWRVNDGQNYDELDVWGRTREAMQWARAGGNAVILPVFSGRESEPGDRTFLANPIDFKRVGDPIALHTFDFSELSVRKWDRDITSPYFRRPVLWDITSDGFQATVHASRLAVFSGSKNPPSYTRRSALPDDSVIQVIWDEIMRLTQTMQGGATLAQELREAVLKVSGMDMIATGDEAKFLTMKLNLVNRARSILGLIVVDKEDDYENRSNPPTGFEELSGGAKSMLAAVSGYSEIVLYGNSPGGLSSDGESGHAMHRQQIADYQEENRWPLMTLYRLMNRGKKVEEIEFHPLDEPSGMEKAETCKIHAETDEIRLRSGVLSPRDVARGRFSDKSEEIYVDRLSKISDKPVKPGETAEKSNAGKGNEARKGKTGASGGA
ncbi:MAG: DUF1073 domain-containing protein [Hyphomicrobium sp.]|nr:DUF1073 domain-containing protein [Hyphomicrobium sp.]